MKKIALFSILGIISLIIILLALSNVFLIVGFIAFLVMQVFVYRSLVKSKPKYEKILTVVIVFADLVILSTLVSLF